MSSGEDSNRDEELAIVNLENVKRISETYKSNKGKNKKGTIPKAVVQGIWKDRLTPRFYSRLMSVMFPEDSNEVSFLSFYTIYKNLAEPETEIMFRALTIYHIATIHEPPFNYEQANEYPNASYKAIKDYVCDVITSYLHAIIHFNMKEALAWLDLRVSNNLIDGNLVASYMLKDLETHRNEVSIGSLEIWLEKNEMYYTVSEQLYLYLFGVNSPANVKPLIPLPVLQTGRSTKTLLALPDVLLLNSKLPKRAQRWTLAHMLDSRSQNWETLKQAIYGKGQTIIVIQDANGDIFGMYGSHKWFPAEGFFGNEECFLFTLKPDVNIYERSGRDNNFQLFTESGIGMGGTADRLGLFIQSGTSKGSTSLSCSTFREFWPVARELEFKITQIEIWSVDYVEAQPVVTENVREMKCNTQLIRMKGSYNEEKLVVMPECKRLERVPEVIDSCCQKPKMDLCGPLKCSGECAKNGTTSSHGRVCCSKRCSKKRKDMCTSDYPRGEGDVYVKVDKTRKYPRQIEESRQCHHKYSEDKVKIKNEKRSPRISLDARQKHGGAGFIHPSLAAEENERNKREAQEAKEANSASPPSPFISKSNRSNTSRKRPSFERNLTQKSNSPTFTHNQVQVGASRLMKTSCRSFKSKNTCGCSERQPCACPPKDTSLPSSSRGKRTSLVRTYPATNKMTYAESISTNKGTSNKTNFNVTMITDEVGGKRYVSQTESSSSISTPINNGNLEENNERMSETVTQKQQSKGNPGTKLEQPVSNTSNQFKQTYFKSEGTSKLITLSEDKRKQEDRSQAESIQKINVGQTIGAATNALTKELGQADYDCHCSSSSDCNEVEPRAKKCDYVCCCEAEATNYLDKNNRTDITGVPLSEISSSVCSCILDNKNKITATSTGFSIKSTSQNIKPFNSSKKEDQNLIKSRRKSAGSSGSLYINATKPKKMHSYSPDYSCASKKETQLHTKSKRESRTCTVSSPSFLKQLQPVPPTCLRCRTRVGQHGCQCQAKTASNTFKPIPTQTSYLVQKEPGKDPLALKSEGSRRSVVIDAQTKSYISEGYDDMLSVGSSSNRSVNRASSQSSQAKQVQKKSCKTSCKCSLSPAYFPIFPEDFIKEGGTLEDCDCASFNNLQFPVIVETPPEPSPHSSVKSHTTPLDHEPVKEPEEQGEEEIKDKKCGCDDNDNTIIILNVSKCNTAETVEKIIHELEEKTDDVNNPNIKSLVLRCTESSDNRPCTLQYSPCTSKPGPEREALRRHIERILKRKSQVTLPDPEAEPQS